MSFKGQELILFLGSKLDIKKTGQGRTDAFKL